MIAYPDTSFLCALYRQQSNSGAAAACFKAMAEALHVTDLLLYEFRQSMRFQVWLHNQNANQGFPAGDCNRALADLRTDLATGALVMVPVEWPDVYQLAERLSVTHTQANGNRALDTLHVATALQLGAQEFLTFDLRQRKLAGSEGLKVQP